MKGVQRNTAIQIVDYAPLQMNKKIKERRNYYG